MARLRAKLIAYVNLVLLRTYIFRFRSTLYFSISLTNVLVEWLIIAIACRSHPRPEWPHYCKLSTEKIPSMTVMDLVQTIALNQDDSRFVPVTDLNSI